MTIGGVLGLLRLHWVLLLTALCVGSGAGAGIASVSQVEYTARAEVFVAVSSAGNASDIAQGATYAQSQARNFGAVATRQVVISALIDSLDLDLTVREFRNALSTSVPLNTSIITLQVVDPSAERASAIANRWAEVLADEVPRLVPRSASGDTPIKLQQVEAATPPSTPSAPRTLLMVVLGAFSFLAFALVGVAAWNTLRAR